MGVIRNMTVGVIRNITVIVSVRALPLSLGN